MMFDEIYGLPKPPDGWAKLSTASFCLPEKNVNKWNLIFYLPVRQLAIPVGLSTKPNIHERLAQNLFLLQCGPAIMLCYPLAAFLALASTPPPTKSEVRTYLHVIVCDNENMQPEILLLSSGDDVCSPELPQAWWQLLMARFWIPDQNVSKSNVEFDLPVHDVVTSGGIDTTPMINEHLAQKRVETQSGPAGMCGQPPATLPMSVSTPRPTESEVFLHLCATMRQDQFIGQENLLLFSINGVDLPALPQALAKLLAALYRLPERKVSYESAKFIWWIWARVIYVNSLFEAHYDLPPMQKLKIDGRTCVVASITFTAPHTTFMNEKKKYQCEWALPVTMWCFTASQLGPTSSLCLDYGGTSSLPEAGCNFLKLQNSFLINL